MSTKFSPNTSSACRASIDPRRGGSPEQRRNATSKKAKKMAFEIDTGDTGGSLGPWITWSSNGSAMKGLPHSSWVLRGKDATGNKSETAIPAFVNGCVMDLDTLKLGWEKDGAKGMAPQRVWNPSISRATQRPDESKTPSGKATWSKALSVRLAIGGGQAATWEQGSFAAYEAFTNLSKQIMAEWTSQSQNGLLLPLVVQSGVERRELPGGSANIPILSVAKWVPRPDCLKADAPVIAAEPAPQPAPAYTPPPVAAASVPAGIAF